MLLNYHLGIPKSILNYHQYSLRIETITALYLQYLLFPADEADDIALVFFYFMVKLPVKTAEQFIYKRDSAKQADQAERFILDFFKER